MNLNYRIDQYVTISHTVKKIYKYYILKNCNLISTLHILYIVTFNYTVLYFKIKGMYISWLNI